MEKLWEPMELNFNEKNVVWEGSHVCESPLIGGAVARGVEESGLDRNVGKLYDARS